MRVILIGGPHDGFAVDCDDGTTSLRLDDVDGVAHAYAKAIFTSPALAGLPGTDAFLVHSSLDSNTAAELITQRTPARPR